MKAGSAHGLSLIVLAAGVKRPSRWPPAPGATVPIQEGMAAVVFGVANGVTFGGQRIPHASIGLNLIRISFHQSYLVIEAERKLRRRVHPMGEPFALLVDLRLPPECFSPAKTEANPPKLDPATIVRSGWSWLDS